MNPYKYSVKQIADEQKCSQSLIRQRAKKLGIKPSIIKGNKIYEFTQG